MTDARGAVGNIGRADVLGDVFAVQADAARSEFDFRGQRELLHAVHVVRADLLPQAPERHGTVHGAGIDVGEAEPLRHVFRDRALAGAGRSVNRDYDYSGIIIGQEIE